MRRCEVSQNVMTSYSKPDLDLEIEDESQATDL